MMVYDVQGVGRIVADLDFVETAFPGKWTLVGEDAPQGEVLPEPPPTPQPQRRHVTRLAFRNRFTAAEKVAIELAALDNEETRVQAATIRAYMKDVDAATFIDLDRVDTRAGVQLLETVGLLAAGRAAEVLDAPVQPEEEPQ